MHAALLLDFRLLHQVGVAMLGPVVRLQDDDRPSLVVCKFYVNKK